MSDKELLDVISRLDQVVDILNKLPPEVRAGAFDVLAPWIRSDAAPAPAKPKPEHLPGKPPAPPSDDGELFSKFNHDKPADNVKLITASLYAQYGLEPFSLTEVRSIATAVGLTIPQRPDMTLKDAKKDGKKLYQSLGHDKYAPTVHGEQYLKATYMVSKGKGQRSKGAG